MFNNRQGSNVRGVIPVTVNPQTEAAHRELGYPPFDRVLEGQLTQEEATAELENICRARGYNIFEDDAAAWDCGVRRVQEEFENAPADVVNYCVLNPEHVLSIGREFIKQHPDFMFLFSRRQRNL